MKAFLAFDKELQNIIPKNNIIQIKGNKLYNKKELAPLPSQLPSSMCGNWLRQPILFLHVERSARSRLLMLVYNAICYHRYAP